MQRSAPPIHDEPDHWESPIELEHDAKKWILRFREPSYALKNPHPAIRLRGRSRPWLRMGLISGLAIVGLAYLAQRAPDALPPRAVAVPPSALTAPAPLWQPIANPSAVYAIELTGRKSPVVLDARRHAGGGREDIFVIAAPGEPGYGRLSLTRGVSEPDASFYVDLVRRAAQAGLSVVRNSQSRSVATKFGAVEAADAILAADTEQSCLAFRFAHSDISFSLHGWLCGSEARPASDTRLACLLDRVFLVNAGDDAALKVLFAQADKHRGETCPQSARLATARKG